LFGWFFAGRQVYVKSIQDQTGLCLRCADFLLISRCHAA